MFKTLTGRKFEISFLLGFPLSSGTTRGVFDKSGKMLCSILESVDNLFVKFYLITYFYIFHDNRKKWVSVAILAFGRKIWVAADKSGFCPLTEQKFSSPTSVAAVAEGLKKLLKRIESKKFA